jgi:hypothetical protein
MGVTRSLFEGLVKIPDKFVPPSVLDAYGKNKLFIAWQSTVQNCLSLGIPTLALARHSLMTDLKAHNAELGDALENLDSEVYQEHILTRQYILYPVCSPIYEFNCLHKALTGIADCIRGELSTLAWAVTKHILHNTWSSIFTILYRRGWL